MAASLVRDSLAYPNNAGTIRLHLTRRMLTRQLRELEAAGLIHREVYAEVPPRVEYSLTPLGRSLEPVIRSLWTWGNGYLEVRRTAPRALNGVSASVQRVN